MAPLSAPELLAICEIDISVLLTAEQIEAVLSHEPFIQVDGTFNVRDVGRVPKFEESTTRLRPNFAFRSGALQRLTDKGKTTLVEDLRVRRIFDLRSHIEHEAAPDPLPADTVTLVWERTTMVSPNVTLEPFADGHGEAGYAAMYMDVLESYIPSFRAVLEHVRDRPHEPFLFHCTAGRDRTGILSGMLLTLAGEPDEVIALDYMLTRVGAEPVRAMIEKFARSGAGVLKDVQLNEVRTADGEPAPELPSPPGLYNLLNLRVKCWNAFLAAMRAKYGPAGFVDYAKSLGFDESDLAKIKTNLTVEVEA